jgi:ABC-type bacteriocin/lantibiotic exporter with double-glycine peptidase domain
MRRLTSILFALLGTVILIGAAQASELVIDKVMIHKQERRLDVLSGG